MVLGPPMSTHKKPTIKVPADQAKPLPPRSPYSEKEGMTWHRRATREGSVTVPLANFTARIVSEVVRDDGAEQSTSIVVAVRLADGTQMDPAEIPANHFTSMNWLMEKLGTRPSISAGMGSKDHLRAAIQHHSSGAVRRVIFTHTGWRKVDGKMVYLHTGGAIGADGSIPGVEVELGGRLADYCLPPVPEGELLRQAIRASLRLLDVVPDSVGVPLLLSTYRAPLGSDPRTTLFLVGRSGSYKTTLAAIAQAHYGAAFHGRHLPEGWSSTANAIEAAAFATADALMVIDDYAPDGTLQDRARVDSTMARIIRGQANGSGRARLRADGSLRPVKPPRGSLITTAEDLPRGHSIRARALICECERGAVDLAVVTEMQSAAERGILAGAMSGYVRWLAPQIEASQRAFPERLAGLRSAFRSSHGQTTDAAASLAIAGDTLLAFAQEAGAITKLEAGNLRTRFLLGLAKVSGAQAEFQADADPVRRFSELLPTVFLSGRAHLASIHGTAPANPSRWGWEQVSAGYTGLEGHTTPPTYRAKGERIGWVDDLRIYLDPEGAFATLQRIAGQQGDTLPVSQGVLWKRLLERGLIEPGEEKRHTKKKTFEGVRHRVVVLLHEAIQSVQGEADCFPKTGTD